MLVGLIRESDSDFKRACFTIIVRRNALVGLHLETEGSGERGQKACSTIMVRQSTLVEF